MKAKSSDAYVLGFNAYAHEASACLIKNGQIIAFCEEERFNRKKHTSDFPIHSIRFCLGQAGIGISEVSHLTFFWNPLLEVWGNLGHFLRYFPKTLGLLRDTGGGSPHSFVQRTKRIYAARTIMKGYFPHDKIPPIYYCEHHLAHAASAFYPSPFDNAAILTLDGRGESTTTLLATGAGTKIEKILEIKVPHSLGHFYSAITRHLGFKPFIDEWKVMGLSAYGTPKYLPQMKSLVEKTDSGFRLNLDYFAFHLVGAKKWLSSKFEAEFGPSVNDVNSRFEYCADIAFAAQKVTEEVGVHLANLLFEKTGQANLCLAGGVALNCLMNQKILEGTPFQQAFIQPVANDAGAAMGSALYYSHAVCGIPRCRPMDMPYWGPSFSEDEIEESLKKAGVKYQKTQAFIPVIAQKLHEGKVIGWFHGNMESGPRALGNRSILADPSQADMKERINKIIKKRENFRPFAPAVMEERARDIFDLPKGATSPYMILAGNVKPDWKAKIPAVVHVDGTARVQTVSKIGNPLFHELIGEFEKLAGKPVLLNTSFNENEPIVCKPGEAIDCFLRSDLDVLSIGPFVAEKTH